MGAASPFLSQHVLQLYQDEAMIAGAISDFVAEGLRADDAVVVIGSRPRWEGMLQRLKAGGIDSQDAVLRGQLRLFGARTILASCMSHGVPDRLAFNEAIDGILSLTRMQGRAIRVFGEVTDMLWRGGDREAALALERFWTALLREQPISLLCACPLDSLEPAAYDGALQRQCALHTHLLPARDDKAFDNAVNRALAQVLEPQLVRMLCTLAEAHRPPTQMPLGQAILLWLRQHMPRTADKVLARADVTVTAP